MIINYQCNPTPHTFIALSISDLVPSIVSESYFKIHLKFFEQEIFMNLPSPRIFIIVAQPTLKGMYRILLLLVGKPGHGNPRIVRTCISNWSISQPSIV